MFGGDALFVEGVEAVDIVFFLADFEGGAGVETVERHDGLLLFYERCRAVGVAGGLRWISGRGSERNTGTNKFTCFAVECVGESGLNWLARVPERTLRACRFFSSSRARGPKSKSRSQGVLQSGCPPFTKSAKDELPVSRAEACAGMEPLDWVKILSLWYTKWNRDIIRAVFRGNTR
jgi:hypothetical protein